MFDLHFIEDTEVEIIEVIEDDTPVTVNETFKAGTCIEVDLVETVDNISQFQFGDGSVCFLSENDDNWELCGIAKESVIQTECEHNLLTALEQMENLTVDQLQDVAEAVFMGCQGQNLERLVLAAYGVRVGALAEDKP